MKIITSFAPPDPAFEPGAGFVDTVRDQLDAVAAHMGDAPDDDFKADMVKAVAIATNSIESIRAFCWATADTVDRRSQRAEGALQGALQALRSNALGAQDSAIDLASKKREVLAEARARVTGEILSQVGSEASRLAKAGLAKLDALESAIKRAKAIAALPTAMNDDETLELLSRRAATEQEILSKPLPAAYIVQTHAALVDVGEDEKAAYFARCARATMITIRDTSPVKLSSQMYSYVPDAVSSERNLAFAWLREQDRAAARAIGESSIAYGEKSYGILKDAWSGLVGVAPLTRRQRVSAFMVDGNGAAKRDVIVPDYPVRAPAGYSPIAQRLQSGAIVRQPFKG